MFDIIIVGCGFSGAAAARLLAEKYNKRVLILEKRNHIGGNMFDLKDTNGVLIHKYGPHIFHTNIEPVFDFLKKFSAFYPYEHSVLAKIDGRLVPVPFNFKSLETLFPENKSKLIRTKLSQLYGKDKVSIFELLQAPDESVRDFGAYVYENVFINYTAKQWGKSIQEIDKSVINRVPVFLSYDNRYFQDRFQYMPACGFTHLFSNLLDHPNIKIELSCPAQSRIKLDRDTNKINFDGKPWNMPMVYTGALDELMDYEFGCLPYRSLDLVFEQHSVTTFQPGAVVNYPNEEKFTRITEFKHMTGQKIENATTILKEYPLPYSPGSEKGNIPYYPVNNDENEKIHSLYHGQVAKFKNIFLCGRLAEYKYYNMDAAIARAHAVSDEIGKSYE
jgi:UDP-galactopyranose mutase